jgi:hypothetical protein
MLRERYTGGGKNRKRGRKDEKMKRIQGKEKKARVREGKTEEVNEEKAEL